ncbi:MAG: PAS domain-containing protein [Nitrospirae bacterium]|nr:PAS domain-containing protein [Nitrospirota bacterium]
MFVEIRKIRALILLRVGITYLLLASFFLYGGKFAVFPYPDLLSNLAVFIFILTILYLLVLKRLQKTPDPKTTGRFHLFTYFQIVFDSFIIFFLIIITGGIDSWFSFLLLVNVISAGVTLGRAPIMIMASLNSIGYGTVIVLQFYRILKVPYSVTLIGQDFFYNIFANMTALFLTAYLSRHLLIRLEKTSSTLKQAESNFQDLYSFHQEVIENIPAGLIYTDKDGKIMLFNRPAEKITGISRETATDRTLYDIFKFVPVQMDTGIFKGTITDYTDDSEKIIEMKISTHTNNSGQLLGFVTAFEDQTRITELQRDMKEKEKLAAIGELSANIAHEIRNPLAALRTSIEMLREDSLSGTLKPERTTRIMDIAIKEMDRLNKIITDFLIYSSPKPPNLTSVYLNRVLRESVDMLRTSVITYAEGGRHISINYDEPESSLMIHCDEDKIKQVFLNLGINALQSLTEGGGLSISVKRLGDFVKITFSDTGTGIDSDVLKKIFYPFYTTKRGGSGLGLAIVYRIIEEHSGKIKVVSFPQKGTTFDIFLPGGG